MIAESLGRRYAAALYKLALERNELEAIKEELQAIDKLLRNTDNFRYFLFSPKVNIDDKKKLFSDILGDKISKTTLHFLFLLLDKKRQTLLDRIYSNFLTLYNNYHNRAVIEVRPAVGLDDTVVSELKGELENLFKKSLSVEQRVSPELIGGLQVRVNNTVYDASVKGKLERMRSALAV